MVLLNKKQTFLRRFQQALQLKGMSSLRIFKREYEKWHNIRGTFSWELYWKKLINDK